MIPEDDRLGTNYSVWWMIPENDRLGMNYSMWCMIPENDRIDKYTSAVKLYTYYVRNNFFLQAGNRKGDAFNKYIVVLNFF